MSKVAIVTSVYNKAPWLDRCFNSFVNQTFSDLEFIVINNGSTDESATIIDKFSKQDPRFKVITLKDNIGPSGAYALGIEKVNTEYFALCDSDDYIPNNYIEVLFEKICEHNADISMCANDMVWDNGKVATNNRPPKSEIIFTSDDKNKLLPQIIDHHSNLYLGYYLAEIGVLWGKMYRTDFVRNLGINYDKDVWIYCDWLFNFELINNLNRMVYTEDTVYHFYQAAGSFTRSKKMNWNELARRKVVLDKFSSICSEFKGKSVIALNRFYFGNIVSVLGMYVEHFPKEVSKIDLIKVAKEISNWPQYKYIIDNKKLGLNWKQKVLVLLIKHNVIFPYVLRSKIRQLLKKN